MTKYHVRRWVLLGLRKVDPTTRDRWTRRFAVRIGWVRDDMRYDWQMLP